MRHQANTSFPDPLTGQAGPVSVAVIGLLTAAVIHVSVVGEHLHEWVPFGITLAAMGLAEAFLAVCLAQRPSRRCWIALCVVSFSTAALWALSRTAGLPIGPDPWHPEVIGRADWIATVAELAAVAAGMRALSARRHAARHPRLIGAIGLAVAVPLTLVALSGATAQMTATAASATDSAARSTTIPGGPSMAGGPSMPSGATMAGGATMPGGPTALDTTTCPNLGGLSAMPDGMVMQPTPKRPATPSEQVAAATLVAQTKAGLQRFTSLAAAQAAGYVPATNPNARVVHWIDRSVVRAKDILDPMHPSSLVYVNSLRGPVLVGAMYVSAGPCQPGPNPAGPLFAWHAHANLCFGASGRVVGVSDSSGRCATGRSIGTTAFMLHVWTAPSFGDPLRAEVTRSDYAKVVVTGVA